MMRIVMVVASGVSYLVNEAMAKAQYANVDKMNYEAPLTRLVWLTSIVSVALTYAGVVPAHPDAGRRRRCGGSCRRSSPAARWRAPIIPELVKVFTSTDSAHVREVVTRRKKAARR